MTKYIIQYLTTLITNLLHAAQVMCPFVQLGILSFRMYFPFNLYFLLRFCLANAINNYLRFKILYCVCR